MGDKRYELIKERLSTLSKEELKRILNNTDILCVDAYNFDEENKKYCPLAIAMNLHETVKNPNNEVITLEIKKRFNPVNILKGINGKFYTRNRKKDIVALIHELLK